MLTHFRPLDQPTHPLRAHFWLLASAAEMGSHDGVTPGLEKPKWRTLRAIWCYSIDLRSRLCRFYRQPQHQRRRVGAILEGYSRWGRTTGTYCRVLHWRGRWRQSEVRWAQQFCVGKTWTHAGMGLLETTTLTPSKVTVHCINSDISRWFSSYSSRPSMNKQILFPLWLFWSKLWTHISVLQKIHRVCEDFVKPQIKVTLVVNQR